MTHFEHGFTLAEYQEFLTPKLMDMLGGSYSNQLESVMRDLEGLVNLNVRDITPNVYNFVKALQLTIETEITELTRRHEK